MPISEDFIERIRECYRRWVESGAKDPAPWLELMHDDIEFLSLGDPGASLRLAADRHGKEQVETYFRELAAEWQLLEWNIDEIVCQRQTLVVLGDCVWRSRRTGRKVHTPKADVAHVEDGRMIRFREFFDTANARAAGELECAPS